MDRTAIEERLAHLTRAVDDLSDVVARQDREIARLRARLTALTEREADREAERDAGAEPPPPHY